MTGSTEFSMLNIDKKSRALGNAWVQPNTYLEYVLEIGTQVEIE